jgi:hypothetical protein
MSGSGIVSTADLVAELDGVCQQEAALREI